MASVEQNPGDKTKRSDFQSSTLYRISEDPSDDFELPWTEFEDWLVQVFILYVGYERNTVNFLKMMLELCYRLIFISSWFTLILFDRNYLVPNRIFVA